MKKILPILILVCFSSLRALSQEVRPTREHPVVFTTYISDVHDGDTFYGQWEGKDTRFRFAAIDCPEINQSFGVQAADFTKAQCLHKTVTLSIIDIDQYGRPVVFIELPNGKILNKELVKAGYAWHFKQYDNDVSYDSLQDVARSAKLGLWKENSPTAPWEWRRQQRKTTN